MKEQLMKFEHLRGGWRRIGLLVAMMSLVVPAIGGAVVLDDMNRVTIKLSDGTDVQLIGEFISKIGGRGVQDDGLSNTVRPASLNAGRHQFREMKPSELVESRVIYISGSKTKTIKGNEKGREQANKDMETHREEGSAKREEMGIPTGQNAKPPGFREHKKSNRYYYLPSGDSLHLSMRKDGTAPEFLFVKYTSDEVDGPTGGLLHFLMEWSLSAKQEEELQAKVKALKLGNCKGGQENKCKLMGAVPLHEADPDGSFRIVSAILSDGGMTRSIVQSGHAPTMPGGKVAAAASLDKVGSALFLATVEKSESIADLSVEMNFDYTVMAPGARGEVRFHWDRLQEHFDKQEQQWRKDKGDRDEKRSWGCALPFGCASTKKTNQKYHYTETDVSTMFDSLVENKVVELVFEGYQPDSEYTGVIIEGMMQYFTNSLMEPADPSELGIAPPDSEEEGDPNAQRQGKGKKAQSYVFKQETTEAAYAKKTEVTRLDFGFAVKKPLNLVGNMASWYKKNKHNKKCVQSVNVSDGFYQQREIRFVMDLDAQDIFDEAVNYVTVNVKKDRKTGPTFTDSVTIDKQYVQEKGMLASVSYSPMDDDKKRGGKSEVYKYQTQWSIRGGNVFPAKPRWQKGSMAALTLAPPIERWEIEVEGDIAQMEESDIARVTIELHYPLFGEEAYKVIPLSVRAGEYLVADKIYVDRGTRGFAYRLIAHHKTEGRMVTDWQTRIGDRYVYATIPEDILIAGAPREQAKAAAKKLGKIGADKVLDKFQELFAKAD